VIYTFNGYPLPLVETVEAPLPRRADLGETPGRPGAARGRAYNAARTVTIEGVLKRDAGTYDDLLADWSALCAALDTEEAAPLVVRTGWYLNAVCESLNDTERGPAYIRYEANFRCSDPYFYAVGAAASAGLASGANAVNGVGGNRPCLPVCSFPVTALGSGGTITVTVGARSFVLTPTALETLVVDCLEENLTGAGGADRFGRFDGEFLALQPGNNTVTVTLGGGLTIGGAAVLTYRARSL
jgi:phage-related protein